MKKTLILFALPFVFACSETPESEPSYAAPDASDIQAKGTATPSEQDLAKFPENAQLIYRYNQNLQIMEKAQAEKIFMQECMKLLTKKGISVSGLTDHEIITKVLTLKN